MTPEQMAADIAARGNRPVVVAVVAYGPDPLHDRQARLAVDRETWNRFDNAQRRAVLNLCTDLYALAVTGAVSSAWFVAEPADDPGLDPEPAHEGKPPE